MLQTLLIHVSGLVQGVFYRQTAKEKARAIGLNGKISNLPDRRVEIVVTGTRDQLNSFLDWCRVGPPKAKVTDLKYEEIPLQDFKQFIIERL